MKSRIKYGREWPEGIRDIDIELFGFKQRGQTPGFLSCYEHALNCVRLLWPHYPLEVTLPDEPYYQERGLVGLTVDNTFFKEAMYGLCTAKKVALTGCASSGKSFSSSMYGLICFYAAPLDTMVMLSTTSGDALKARIWGEIKKLHNEVRYEMPGTILDYLKALVFDPSLALKDEKDASQRDMRNGLIGIAIPNDSQGEGALTTIAGRKNQNVIWIIDEMPFMPEKVQDPWINLMANPFFQAVVLGNANKQTDPHGRFCEPITGWPEEFTESSWVTKTGGLCIHLDGTRSPNLFPGHEKIDNVAKLPFPSIINHIALKEMAIESGQGDIEQGRKSSKYWMMARGIWLPSSLDATVLSASIVKASGADRDIRWGYGDKVRVAAADPSFTIGGDKFYLHLGTIGYEEETSAQVLVPDTEPILITPEMGIGGDLYDQLAAKVVRILNANNVLPGNFGLDASHDGGLMGQAIMKLWGTNDIHLISSLGSPTDRRVSDQDNAPAKDRYDRQVTEYWFSMRVAVQLGRIKGFNLVSEYARDVFERKYDFRPGGKVSIETKKDFKERLKRSCDAGDAFSYLCEIARRAGLPMERLETLAPRVSQTLSFDPITLKPKEREDHPAYKKQADRGWSRFQGRSLTGWKR
jgi:hypothetical protein